MKQIIEKVKSVILGHAVADALGVPVEFVSREELREEPLVKMEGYGTYEVPAGSWSDDTSMALAALDSLASGRVDYFDIMTKFFEWQNEGKYTPTGTTFDIGTTCMRAIRCFVALCEKGEAFDPLSCGQRGEYNNGNGSLMRIHPFALMAWYDRDCRPAFEEMIDCGSALTHAHPRSLLACRIYALLLYHLLEVPSREVIPFALEVAKERYQSHPEYPHFARLLEGKIQEVEEAQIESDGYVIHTLEAAVWCLLTTNSYRDCVLKAVNLGEDTDTTAAVAGGLAGALYGYENIPAEWKDTLIKRAEIEALCERATVAWMAEKVAFTPCALPLIDLHMHIVPNVDDGARVMAESLHMLKMSAAQGVTDVFCTSHNRYTREEGEAYKTEFAALQAAVEAAGIPIRLHVGCEVLFANEYIGEVLYGLDEGIFPTLGNTRYILTEFYPDTKPTEALEIVRTLVARGYKPIIAHMERNTHITGFMVSLLIASGARIQINARSLVDHEHEELCARARALVAAEQAHFLGSDAHRCDRRLPELTQGAAYILAHASPAYAEALLYGNAQKLLQEAE